MRLLALLGVGAGAVAVGLMVVVPSTADAEFNGGVRLIVSAVVTAMIGVSLTAFALWGYFRYQIRGPREGRGGDRQGRLLDERPGPRQPASKPASRAQSIRSARP